jgi:protocatechuate 3,4-dioxygenase beta subunit
MERRLTRAGLLRLAGAFGAVFGLESLRGGWLADEAAGGPAGVSSGTVSCVLAPEQTEGPYYVPNERLRRNITEGRPGRPLTLRLKVVDASTCRPIKGAAVDVWHCDALGLYSGVGGSPGNFMRGVQRTNAKGIATFQTVYPGWYGGRTVHIHVKVHVRGNVVHTGQLYFPDRLTDAVYRRAPYSRRPNRTTRNAADAIFRNGGRRSLLQLRRIERGYLGRITMGVHRS